MIVRLLFIVFALLIAGLALVFVWPVRSELGGGDLADPSAAQGPGASAAYLRLGSTTSTRDSGLLDYLLPLYFDETGVEVVVFTKGTGAAIRDGLEGRVDALLVHHQTREEALVADGYALERLPIMSNQYMIVGPKDQLGFKEIARLLSSLARGERGLFLSRGDESGTHAAELAMWAQLGFDPDDFGDWYVETGTGMGQTLITANANRAHTLVDSATWARHGDKDALHVIHDGIWGDTIQFFSLDNPYGYVLLNPERISGINLKLARDFGAWLSGPKGQAAIAAFRIGEEQVFVPHMKL